MHSFSIYQLAPVNEEMDQILQQSKELEEKQKLEMEMQTLCESFIKGQGSLYVLEDGNKIETDNGIEDNGPEYVERSWNERTIGKAMIESFLSVGGGGHRIFPKFQEYAITIAVSSSLMNYDTLAKYQSHDFPNITFKSDNNGSVYIINGHHQIAAWKRVHNALLLQQQKYVNIMKGRFAVDSDGDTSEIIEARANLAELKKKLFKEGGWGAVVLDYGE
jgi:hypothetical protein